MASRSQQPILGDKKERIVQELTKWLGPTDYLSPGGEFMKHMRAYLPGTGDWVRKTTEYKDWIGLGGLSTTSSPSSGCLWIKGVPGSGKSVFSASVASQIHESQPDTPVLYFFFRQIIQNNHRPCNLVRDYATQLLPYSESLRTSLLELKKTKGNMFDQDAVWDAICVAMDGLDRVYCIADALDEMDDDYLDFINTLKALGKRQPNKIKLLLTSRPIPKIENALKDLDIAHIRLEPSKIYPDVTKYVKKSMGSLVPRLSEETEVRVIEALCASAKGLFLHARLLMDNLEEDLKTDKITEASLPSNLQKLPTSLSVLYDQMLKEHARRSGVDEQEQVRILSCVIHSKRRLRVLELGAMLEHMRGETNKLKKYKLLVYQSCGRLLEIQRDETVSVIHHSFTEFLSDQSRDGGIQDSFPVLNSKLGHQNLAMACCEYIAAIPFSPPTETPKPGWLNNWDESSDNSEHLSTDLQPVYLEWPLAEYAVQYGLYHIKDLPQDDEVAVMLLTRHIRPNKYLFDIAACSWWLRLNLTAVTALHLAVHHNLIGYAKQLLKENPDTLNTPDLKGRTALIIAVENGQEKMVELLIESGADLVHVDNKGFQAIHHVNRDGKESITGILLKSGVDPLSPTHPRTDNSQSHKVRYSSALEMVCRDSNTGPGIFAEFIPYLSQAQLADCYGIVLHADHMDCILSKGLVDVDMMLGGRTKLFEAAGKRDLDAIKVLLKHGADPNRRCSFRQRKDPNLAYQSFGVDETAEEQEQAKMHGPTPMHAWAGYDHHDGHYHRLNSSDAVACLQLLVEVGGGHLDDCCGKHNGYDNQACTATYNLLHLVAQAKGDDLEFVKPIIEYLMENGCDINARVGGEEGGLTAAHLCVAELESHGSCNTSTLEQLYEFGADLTLKNGNGQTPFLVFLTHDMGNELSAKTIDILRTDNPSCHIDAEGDGILHYLFDLSTFQDNCCYEHIWTEMPIKLVLELMKAGENINARNEGGQTPLFKYSSTCVVDDACHFKVLVENEELDIHIVDNSGRNIILHHCAKIYGSYRALEHIKLFIELGVNPNIQDNDGNTAIHLAMSNDDNLLNKVKLLVEHGVDAKQINKKGETTIHTALRQIQQAKIRDTIIEYLESVGVPPFIVNENGQSKLHINMATGNFYPFDISKPLAEHHNQGLSINHLDNFGIGALHYAAAVGNSMAVNAFVAAGARTDILLPNGLSVIHLGAFHKGFSIDAIVKNCRTQGNLQSLINLHDSTKQQKTALHYACQTANANNVALLLDNGADVNSSDGDGYTPLHSVIESPLIQRWNGHDKSGEIHILVEPPGPFDDEANMERPSQITDRSPEVINSLVMAGADLNHQVMIDGIPSTPLDRAIEKGYHHIIRELVRHRAKTSPGRALVEHMDWSYYQTKLDLLLKLHHGAISDSTKDGRGWHLFTDEFASIVNGGHFDIAVDFFERITTIIQQPGVMDITQSPLLVLVRLVEKTQLLLLDRLQNIVRTYFALARKIPKAKGLLSAACQKYNPSYRMIKYLVNEFEASAGELGTALNALIFWDNRGGSIDCIRYLLEHGADANYTSEDSWTPLLCLLGRPSCSIEVVNLLLEKGADPNAAEAMQGYSTLSLCEDPDIMRLLIAGGADARLEVHARAIYAAGSSDGGQNEEMIQLLIDAGQNVNRCIDGKYVLIAAAKRREKSRRTNDGADQLSSHQQQEALCSFLIRTGADPWLVCDDGRSIIQVILEENGLVKPILEIPSLDINRRMADGRSTLLIAACKPFATSRPYSSDRPNPPTVLPDIIAKILDLGAEAQVTDGLGRCALHWLCTLEESSILLDDNNIEAVLLRLIETAPSAITLKDNDGYTPLHLATMKRHSKIMDILLNHGADLFDLDPKQNSALHWFSSALIKVPSDDYDATEEEKSTDATDQIEYFSNLITLGLDINQSNIDGETPLFGFVRADPEGTLSKWEPYGKALSVFIDNQADPSHQDIHGENVLHILAKQSFGWQSKKQLLFKKLWTLGADPRQENKQFQTAIDIASSTSNNKILAYFKPDWKDNDADDGGSDSDNSDIDGLGENDADSDGDNLMEDDDAESEPGYEVVSAMDISSEW